LRTSFTGLDLGEEKRKKENGMEKGTRGGNRRKWKWEKMGMKVEGGNKWTEKCSGKGGDWRTHNSNSMMGFILVGFHADGNSV